MIQQKNDLTWVVPKEGTMNVDATIFANKSLMDALKDDKSLEQLKNVSKLPGIISAIVMPDAHQGYGFPIGGVAAFDLEKGVISPGGVGYDINCSVRLLATNLTLKDIKGKEELILSSLVKAVPSGVGSKSKIALSKKELDNVLLNGAQWAISKGYGIKEDYEHTEDYGKLTGANPSFVSERAKGRGMHQLGSLGAGNHFVDVLIVEEIFDTEIAKAFGLELNQVVILIHCGSRGLGHQVASDYIKKMIDAYGVPKEDKDLIAAPISSKLGQEYLAAMKAAANFAFANKQLITYFIREELKKLIPSFQAKVVYDVCHNIAKIETHTLNGKDQEVLVIRKGATRSFGPGRKELPSAYQKTGQPVLIPGSMATPSYVLVGTKEAEILSFGSTAHGAGRVKSRTKAKGEMTYEEASKELKNRGIFIHAGTRNGLLEEFPESYKNIEEVIATSDKAGIGKKVAKLKPVIVVIG